MNRLSSFNPDLFVREREIAAAAEAARTVPGIRPSDNQHLQDALRKGLDRLNAMERPLAFEASRWAQIVLDAHRFAWEWHVPVLRLRWSIGSLFGYDPRRHDEGGLVLDIRGGRVFAIERDQRGRDVAAIAAAGGGGRHHYRRSPDDAPALWTMRGGR